MASTIPSIGTGSSIALTTSTWEANIEVLSIEFSGAEREVIETTHLGTVVAGAGKFGGKTFIGALLSDPGEVTIEFHPDPDKAWPTEDAEDALTLTYAGGGAEWAGPVVCTSGSLSVPLEDKMTGSATFKFTGPVTVTAAA